MSVDLKALKRERLFGNHLEPAEWDAILAALERAERLWTCGNGHIIEIEPGTPPYEMGMCPICTALERIPEMEARIRDKNFELTGVHEALRKETKRAERVEAAARKYGKHLSTCAIEAWHRRDGMPRGYALGPQPQCDCGLSAAFHTPVVPTPQRKRRWNVWSKDPSRDAWMVVEPNVSEAVARRGAERRKASARKFGMPEAEFMALPTDQTPHALAPAPEGSDDK